ncbi:N-acyl homoserine lactonase family protein [Paenibacillus sp. HW567]|uniref:N-acyl homoserine lactonase family protein n=1 Tax=Paenibacillus sp. HW567 TaxID=1034769 RepID=UPI00035EED11|nr:N-acyl homoserine lactonase family protein [Paenibacillus sp. HW567]
MAATAVKKLYVLLCGFEVLPLGVSIRGSDNRIIVAEPICAYLAETEIGWVLFDTGIDASRIHDPVLAQTYYIDRGWTTLPVVHPAHSLTGQLEEIGVRPEDIHQVVLSHMHVDHTGYLKLFRHAKIIAQRAEHHYALHTPPELGNIIEDYNLPELDWQLIEGDCELMPGIQLISTPGHTPGHQSALISLPSGTRLVLTFDAGDFLQNFEQNLLPGSASDDAQALASILRLKQLAGEPGSMLFPLHDPGFIQTAKLAPLYYD